PDGPLAGRPGRPGSDPCLQRPRPLRGARPCLARNVVGLLIRVLDGKPPGLPVGVDHGLIHVNPDGAPAPDAGQLVACRQAGHQTSTCIVTVANVPKHPPSGPNGDMLVIVSWFALCRCPQHMTAWVMASMSCAPTSMSDR